MPLIRPNPAATRDVHVPFLASAAALRYMSPAGIPLFPSAARAEVDSEWSLNAPGQHPCTEFPSISESAYVVTSLRRFEATNLHTCGFSSQTPLRRTPLFSLSRRSPPLVALCACTQRIYDLQQKATANSPFHCASPDLAVAFPRISGCAPP